MFRGIISLVGTLGGILSTVLRKHGRYVPGLDEVLEILKQVGPIIAQSDHPDAPQLSMRIVKALDKEKV